MYFCRPIRLRNPRSCPAGDPVRNGPKDRVMEVPTLLLLLISSVFCTPSFAITSDSTLSVDAIGCLTKGSSCGEQHGDPLTGLRVMEPKEGAVETTPVTVRLFVDADSVKGFNAYYADAYICVELNALWKKCKSTGGPPTVFRLLPEGNYTAIAYITDKTEMVRYHETTPVRFTVMGSSEFNLHNALLAARSRKEQHFPEDIDLLRWSELENRVDIEDRIDDDKVILPRISVKSTNSPMLVIGVKTAVVTDFPRRQAIRDTWANPATLPHDVKVLFLGCEPNMTVFQNEHDRRRFLRALAKERVVFKDLLTEELECTDSYRNLSKKVKSFMHLAAAEFPDAKFVMLVDDDVYVKVDQLVEHLRFANVLPLYFGEVWAETFANKQEPIRDPNSPYHLPEDQYPMRSLLPYGSGPHYIVSMDGVRFIAKNYWNLRSMNGLEDVSSGFWLRLMRIQAQHAADFSSIRSSMTCEDDLVSFADLSPLGIRSIHANLVSNRRFCHGFHSVTWHRHMNSIPTVEKMLQRSTPQYIHPMPLQLEAYVDSSDPLQLTVIVSSPFNAGMKLQFTPSAESVDGFVQRLCSQLTHGDPTSPRCQDLNFTFVTQFEIAFQENAKTPRGPIRALTSLRGEGLTTLF